MCISNFKKLNENRIGKIFLVPKMDESGGAIDCAVCVDELQTNDSVSKRIDLLE